MSNAEARSWWADVQHLRPDAPAGPLLVSEPEPADGAVITDPLLTPEPGRRFARGSAEPRQAPDHDRVAPRRIVVLADESDRRPAPAERPATRRPATEPDRAAPAADPGRPRAARAAGGDVDFDFGRATEDRARRRTAERLGTPSNRARHETMGPTPTARAAAPGGQAAVEPGASGVPAGLSRASTGRTAVSTGRSRASSRPTAVSTSSSAGAAGPALVPLSPPPARRGVLRRLDSPSRTAGARPRRPRGNQTASRPDRMALWAVVLGILLIALAAASSRAEAATHAAPAPAFVERTITAGPAAPAPAAVLR